jgi:LysM repeat protein
MNNNPSNSPEMSPLETKTQGRARVKLAVFSIIAVHVVGLMALLMTQGCKREKHEETPQAETPVMDTNALPPMDTNVMSMPTNVPSVTAPVEPTPPVATAPVAPATTEYVVQKGDSFYTIAKSHGTTTKAMEAANPGVDSRHLKVNQKINLPAPSVSGASQSAATTADAGGESVYTVKSGDTLSRIATHAGTTVKAIKALNNLTTDRISVGQKLKLPTKAPTPAVPEMPAPAAPSPAPQAGGSAVPSKP